jgi:catechol 2,3-dioxygenase-like lactoylglutathione lyase family enzyme
VSGFDHVALPTADAERFMEFYQRLGFGIEGADAWRDGRYPIVALTFGNNKINVHPETMVARRGDPSYLRGPTAEPGCGDLCFVWEGGTDALLAMLEESGVAVIDGPVSRDGGRDGGRARGVSVYVRDPDDNLLEFISYEPADRERYGTGPAPRERQVPL